MRAIFYVLTFVMSWPAEAKTSHYQSCLKSHHRDRSFVISTPSTLETTDGETRSFSINLDKIPGGAKGTEFFCGEFKWQKPSRGQNKWKNLRTRGYSDGFEWTHRSGWKNGQIVETCPDFVSVNRTSGVVTLSPSDDLGGYELQFFATTVTGRVRRIAVDTLSLTVVAHVEVNQPPTSANSTFDTSENADLSGVLPAAIDGEGTFFSWSIESGTTNGSVSLTDPSVGSFIYSPTANFDGTDSFTYRVCDDGTPSLCSPTYTASITISNALDPCTTGIEFFDNTTNTCVNIVTENTKRLLQNPGDFQSTCVKVNNACDLHGALLVSANLTFVDLSGVNFSGAILDLAQFAGSNLSGANLAQSSLYAATMPGVNLSGATLSDAFVYFMDMYQSVLTDAHLERADLRFVDFRSANLSGAHLEQANLRYANLAFATLANASLQGADLSFASLSVAGFQGANLQGATITNFTEAMVNNLTIFPDGLSYPVYGSGFSCENSTCSTTDGYLAN